MRRLTAVLGMAAGVTIGASQDPAGRFSTEIELVEVYVTVTDPQGRPVTGLTRDDFQVFENDRPRAVELFAAGEFPLTVALGVDRSGSMTGEPLRLAKQASQSFLGALRPADRSMVVAIGSRPLVVAPLSTDRGAQQSAVAALDAWSTTALHDAIVATLDLLEGEAGRQALVVFSDGIDRYSRLSAADVLERARRSQTLIYPVAIGRTRPAVIAELAALTGGRSFLVRGPARLEETLAVIAAELRAQYLLGYAPDEPAPAGRPEWRSIRVSLKVPRPGFRVRARDGYFTP